ncbi:MAG TPA: nuclear transport factor 2 family protein [Bryobacteraceae bacterium]
MEQHREEILSLLTRINNAWSQGRPLELNQYFDDQMVIRGPQFQEMGRGREACVRSYVDFLNNAKVHQFSLGEVQVDLHGDTAMATYPWEMTYELQSGTYTESGYDLFVFSHASGAWRAIWRAMLVK